MRGGELRENGFAIMMSAAALNFADSGGPDPARRGNSLSGFSGTLALGDRRQWRHDIVRGVSDFFELVSPDDGDDWLLHLRRVSD